MLVKYKGFYLNDKNMLVRRKCVRKTPLFNEEVLFLDDYNECKDVIVESFGAYVYTRDLVGYDNSEESVVPLKFSRRMSIKVDWITDDGRPYFIDNDFLKMLGFKVRVKGGMKRFNDLTIDECNNVYFKDVLLRSVDYVHELELIMKSIYPI